MEVINYIGPLAIPLLLLSLIGFSLIVERTVFYIRLASINECSILATLKQILQENANQPKKIRDELVSFMLIKSKKPFVFAIKQLRIIAVVSPMVGLLGTVMGIIESFKTIASHDGPVYPSLIAEGLWTAMLTTAVGLIIALPCLIAAFIFSRMGEKRVDLYLEQLNIASLQMEGVKIES
ncbi:MAG: MotA/TolQ/ExbB proton channel family protein [Rickettsiales bacterium]|nr:MotA/TolQ/ExbB proton channel family protein [Rickettsiales bacterium]